MDCTYLDVIKKNRKITTRNWLDLETNSTISTDYILCPKISSDTALSNASHVDDHCPHLAMSGVDNPNPCLS